MLEAIALILLEAAIGCLFDFWLDPVLASKCKLVLAMIFALYGLYEATSGIWYRW